jgi:hypothetical protein
MTRSNGGGGMTVTAFVVVVGYDTTENIRANSRTGTRN